GMFWAVAAGKGLAYGLLFLGVLVVFTTGLLLNGLWLAAIGWFLLTAAEASGRDFVLSRIMKNIRAGDIMRHEVPIVPSHVSIEDWIHDYVLRTGQRAFLVEENGHIIGLITLADANRIPKERWPEVEVYQAMTPLAKLYTVTPDTPLLDVVKVMDEHALNQIPVMVGDRVAGWIDRERLVETLQLHVQLAH
ncbi:MAG: CBS domain-containing protein, partial [Gammaproteobacteria bacterium]